MDFGLKGRTALVCAASAGLGKACAAALAAEGAAVTITGRDEAKLARAAAQLQALTGTEIKCAAGDITTEAGRAAALALCPSPDILINNAGGPPPGDFRTFTDEQWQAALNGNLMTPIRLINAVIGPMIERRFGRIVNITSGAVKTPNPVRTLSNTARTGLTGFVAGVSREVAKYNVTINNLLPGAFDTARLRTTMEAAAKRVGETLEQEMQKRAFSNPAGRIGDPDEFGAMCAFLCSTQAGYVVGQNILLDGGAFYSTM